MKKDKWCYDGKWISFYFANRFDISYKKCGYFDPRPRIIIALGFFSLTIILPFYDKEWENECDPPKWGIAIHNNTFWVYRGGKGNDKGGNKWWTYDFPFINKKWMRTSVLLKDGTWANETPGNKMNFYEDSWNEKKMTYTYEYTDSYDGEVIPTTIYVDEREWRPKWLTWTKLFREVRRTIDIHFSKECGRRKGSWKGGTIGCSYELLKDETPIECIKRMEKEREM